MSARTLTQPRPPEAPTARSPRAAGVYLHIPFCRTKCSYCDFNCYAGQGHLIPPYVDALARELEGYGGLGWRADTLYFGGGTPSLLSPEQVACLVRTACGALGLGDAEVTLEANPGTVDERYFAGLLEAGVNRLSIGVQSFYDSDLRPLARHHTAEDARDAYRDARRAGFGNISLDLIYGLPGQSLEAWRHNLEEAVALGPDHLSLYALIVEEGTPLARQVARGRVRPADDDLVADMYELAHDLLRRAGFRRYEISSWAKPGRESRHNLIYWRNTDYVGAGAGAHGYLAGVRYSNEWLPRRYIEGVGETGFSLVESEEIGAELERAETIILGLRLEEGVSPREFRDRFGLELGEVFGPQLARAEGWGLVEWRGGRIALTDRGRLLSNEVFESLLPG